MRITQWFIFIVSFMLVIANLRMLGAQDIANIPTIDLMQEMFYESQAAALDIAFLNDKDAQEVEAQLSQKEQACEGEPACLQKVAVMRQFFQMLQERTKKRIAQLESKAAYRRVHKKAVHKKQNHLQALNTMHRFVERYENFLVQKNSAPRAHEEPQIEVQTQNEPVALAPSLLEVASPLEQKDTPIALVLNEISKKIDGILTQEPKIVKEIIPAQDSSVANALETMNEKIAQFSVPRQDLQPEKKDDTIAIAINEINEKINDLYEQRERESDYKETMQTTHQAPATLPAQPYYQQPQQPMVYMPQPFAMQNNQTAQMAMQLQSQAMAMQQQASMLMMQAQQAQMQPIGMSHYMTPAVPQSSYVPYHAVQQQQIFKQPAGNRKQDKIDRLMASLQDINRIGEHAIQRLLWLVDLEFDLIEHLLNGEAGHVVERAVQERNAALKNSIPAVVDAYNTVLELATARDAQTDSQMYDYVLRKGRHKQSQPVTKNNGKKQFLFSMRKSLQHYYTMIQNMQQAFNAVTR